MPIKIHHGPPGSYKTGGAMGDDFLREARAGRVIVTNVRGVSRERCLEEFPDLPESFDVIHVSDQTEEGRKKWAQWFHWVPKGAFIFVDEVQDIWPRSWRDANIRALDYPGGVEQAAKDDRPKDWEQAWDKHRHWNWDIVCTTPQYKKVRDDIKGVADAAYKHKDLALVGWTGRYIEAMHLADDDGKNQNDFLNVQRKKVPSYVFKLYDSTATGQHRTNKNGFNLLLNPRILLLLGLLGGALALVLSNGRPAVLGGASASATGKPVQTATASAPASGAVPAGNGGNQPPGTSGDVTKPFEGDDVYIVMSVRFGHVWKYVVSFAGVQFTNNQILDMGYRVTGLGSCGVKIDKDGWSRLITCGQTQQAQREADKPSGSVPVVQHKPGQGVTIPPEVG